MRPKTITVDFYKPSIQSTNEVSLEEIIQSVDAIEEAEDRWVDLDNCPVRLARLERSSSNIIGELTRLRVDDPAVRGHRSGRLDSVVMDDDEALTAFTCFLYNTRHNILCLERNRLGTGQKNFCRYFQSRGDFEGVIGLEIIIDPDVLEQVEGMQTFRTLEVSIAKLSPNAAVRRSSSGIVSRAMEIADDLEAPKVKLRMSMGNFGGSLNRNQFMRAVRAFLRIGEEGDDRVESLKLSGSEGVDDNVHPLDLIKERITFTDSVQLSHDPDQLYQVRRDLLRRAWDDKRSTILRLVGE